jgi:ABC-type spermidine/putrescine transport system permease subunit II
MIVGCPRCHRKFRFPMDRVGQFVECICETIFKIPDDSGPGLASAPSGFMVGGESLSPGDSPSGPWTNLLLPNPTSLVDLSPFKALEPEVKPPEPGAPPVLEADVPEIGGELPDLDDEDPEDLSFELPSDDDVEDEEELSFEQEQSLSAVDLAHGNEVDSRLWAALEELEQSENPQFIIDMLYYLLEIKDVKIEETVLKFVGHQNPLADYFAKRILKDIERIKASTGKHGQEVDPFLREQLFSSLFHGKPEQKKSLVDEALTERWFGAVPYFIVQLLRERNVGVISEILSRFGLLSTLLEAPFLGRFLSHSSQDVQIACVEGLAGIGGSAITYHLISGIPKGDSLVVQAIKKALKTCEKKDIAIEIRRYLMYEKEGDKTGYIALLKENPNQESLRTLIWLLEDTSVRNYALEAIRDMPLEDDDKILPLEEYLMLSHDDGDFCNELIELMEILQPSFDATRLTPINVFDDTYVGQVRYNPLFARDFNEVENAEEGDSEEAEEKILDYDPREQIKKVLDEITELGKGLKSLSRAAYHRSSMISYALVILLGGFIALTSLLSGLGSSLIRLPLNFIPKQFNSQLGFSIFTDSAYSTALGLALVILTLTLIGGWLLGSCLAVSQLRSGDLRPRFLPCFPLLVPPVIHGYAAAAINAALGIKLVKTSLIFFYLFPCISIFYLIYLRLFARIPLAQVDAARSLGASEVRAHATVYGPVYHLGSLYAAALCALYVLGTYATGYFFESPDALGFLVLEKTHYYSGWIMVGAHGTLLASFAILVLLTFQPLIPLFTLVPGGAPSDSEPLFERSKIWLSLLGRILYSRTFHRKIRKAKKPTPPPTEAAEKSQTTAETSPKEGS